MSAELAPLRLLVTWDGQKPLSVSIENDRPVTADRLVGRAADEAVKIAPVICNLAKRAHAAAASAAVAAARTGEAHVTSVEEERAVAAEAAQEHLWRLLLDWPVMFERPVPRDRFGNLHRRLALLKDQQDAFTVGGAILDMVALELMAGFYQTVRGPRNLTEFVERCRRGGSVGASLASLIETGSIHCEGYCVPLLPVSSAADWAAMLNGMPDAVFRRHPQWRGQPMETGALATHPGRPLVAMLLSRGHRIAARLFARVMELSDCASRLRHPLAPDLPALVDAAPLGPGMGLARVETARGVLLHAVRLENEKVADYAIVTPGLWNFHPGGAFASEAMCWQPSSDRAATLARLRWLALSLDPGNAFEVVLAEAADA